MSSQTLKFSCSKRKQFDQPGVHNTSISGASFITEVEILTSEKRLIKEAELRMNFSIAR